MTRLFKIKYIVIVMVALAVITSVTAFSVSYAKWTGGTDSIYADMGTGIWDNNDTPVSKYEFGLCDASTGEDFDLKKNFEDYGGGNYYFEMYLLFTKNSTFTLAINGQVLTDIPDSEWKQCDIIIDKESGEVDLFKVELDDGKPKIFCLNGGKGAISITDVTSQVKTEGNDYYLAYDYGASKRITDYLTKIN